MTSVSDVKFGTLVLRAGGAGWLRFILWLNPKRSLDRKMVLFSFCRQFSKVCVLTEPAMPAVHALKTCST